MVGGNVTWEVKSLKYIPKLGISFGNIVSHFCIRSIVNKSNRQHKEKGVIYEYGQAE